MNNCPYSILSIDLGATSGIAVYDEGDIVFTEEYKITCLSDIEETILPLIKKYNVKLIIVPYPTRIYWVIVKQSQQMGVVKLVAEKNNISVVESNDKHCKKNVSGSGAIKKEHIKEIYPAYPSEHVRDAVMFIDSYLIDCSYARLRPQHQDLKHS